MSLRIIVGGETTKVSKTTAEEELTTHPNFPKGADYQISEANGRWVAAFVEAKGDPEEGDPENEEKTAEAKESEDSKESADSTEDVPEEKTAAGPEEMGPPADQAAPLDAPSEDPEEASDPLAELGHDLKIVKGQIAKIVMALGIQDKGGRPPEGAQDPMGRPADPYGAPAPGSPVDGKGQIVPKQKVPPRDALLKPGVSPPAFASKIPKDHPWREQIEAKVLSFELEAPIGDDEKISSIIDEVLPLAEGTGYVVSNISDDIREGQRFASVTIEAEVRDEPIKD